VSSFRLEAARCKLQRRILLRSPRKQPQQAGLHLALPFLENPQAPQHGFQRLDVLRADPLQIRKLRFPLRSELAEHVLQRDLHLRLFRRQQGPAQRRSGLAQPRDQPVRPVQNRTDLGEEFHQLPRKPRAPGFPFRRQQLEQMPQSLHRVRQDFMSPMQRPAFLASPSRRIHEFPDPFVVAIPQQRLIEMSRPGEIEKGEAVGGVHEAGELTRSRVLQQASACSNTPELTLSVACYLTPARQRKTMNNSMDRAQHHQCVQRALELGRSNDPATLPELISLLQMPSAEIRRLSASAISKLADFGAAPVLAVAALLPVALRDPHPQTQQYALKALKCFGTAAQAHLHDLDDLATNERVKDYVRRAAHSAATAIREAVRLAEDGARHRCIRCAQLVSPEEHRRSQQAFQRTFCDRCFDEVFLERRNFDTKVELSKTIQAEAGTLVQSDGERLIANWLAAHRIEFRYDERYRILNGHAIRPDFYLPELDVYIEYWGLDTTDYQIGMLKKKQLYQQEGKRLISIHPPDKPDLDSLLRAKLSLFGYHIPASASPSESAG